MQVVGIGASAGGIEAFRLFFEAIPADSGMGFVVVLHTSADRKSMLPEIIARWTAMPVIKAANGDRVKSDRVYVIPSGYIATMRQGALHLRPGAPNLAKAPSRGERHHRRERRPCADRGSRRRCRPGVGAARTS
jgi:two-component system CheB/CheR fusion protein